MRRRDVPTAFYGRLVQAIRLFRADGEAFAGVRSVPRKTAFYLFR